MSLEASPSIVQAVPQISCVGFSMVTNKATGLGAGPIAHADVLKIGKEAGARLARLIVALLKELAPHPQSTTTK